MSQRRPGPHSTLCSHSFCVPGVLDLPGALGPSAPQSTPLGASSPRSLPRSLSELHPSSDNLWFHFRLYSQGISLCSGFPGEEEEEASLYEL